MTQPISVYLNLDDYRKNHDDLADRSVIQHMVEGQASPLFIGAIGDRNGGNSFSQYAVYGEDGSLIIALGFQNGNPSQVGQNGVTIEALLGICVHRLENIQQSKFACDENQHALDFMSSAIAALKGRTQRRMNEGVEGTQTPEPTPPTTDDRNPHLTEGDAEENFGKHIAEIFGEVDNDTRSLLRGIFDDWTRLMRSRIDETVVVDPNFTPFVDVAKADIETSQTVRDDFDAYFKGWFSRSGNRILTSPTLAMLSKGFAYWKLFVETNATRGYSETVKQLHLDVSGDNHSGKSLLTATLISMLQQLGVKSVTVGSPEDAFIKIFKDMDANKLTFSQVGALLNESNIVITDQAGAGDNIQYQIDLKTGAFTAQSAGKLFIRS